MKELIDIELSKIVPNKDNEKVFSMSDIKLLAQTIKDEGFYGGIEVFKIPNKDLYEISSGHRRYEAMKLLKKKTIPCIVSDYPSDFKRGVKMLVSNIRSRKLSPLEMARAIDYYEKLLKKEKFKGDYREKIAQFFNMSLITVYRHQCLLRIIPELQELADDPQFPYSAFREAATLSVSGQKELYKDIIYFLNAQKEDDKDYALTRPRIEQLIGNIKEKENRKKETKKKPNIPAHSDIDYKPLDTKPDPSAGIFIAPAIVNNVNDGSVFTDKFAEPDYGDIVNDESVDAPEELYEKPSKQHDDFAVKTYELRLLRISENLSLLEDEINSLPSDSKKEAAKLVESLLANIRK